MTTTQPDNAPALRLHRANLSARRVGKAGSVLLLAAVVAWSAGFAWFVRGAVQQPQRDARADGIVVLTGGADRIVTGVRLLQQRRARVLLISGVGHGADLAALLRGTGIDPASLTGRVTLGHGATSTAGNADETASWVAGQGLHSLLVVTAGYHMARAMTELQRSLPGIGLIAVPVMPPALRAGTGGLSAWSLLAREYTKWLAAQLGIARIGRSPDLQSAPGSLTGQAEPSGEAAPSRGAGRTQPQAAAE